MAVFSNNISKIKLKLLRSSVEICNRALPIIGNSEKPGDNNNSTQLTNNSTSSNPIGDPLILSDKRLITTKGQ